MLILHWTIIIEMEPPKKKWNVPKVEIMYVFVN